MQRPPLDVLIVGAGPTGLTMACELLRRGVTCRILVKTATPAITSRAIGLQVRSLELFANMGVVEPVLKQGIPGIKVNANIDGKLTFRLDFRFLANESIPPPRATIKAHPTAHHPPSPLRHYCSFLRLMCNRADTSTVGEINRPLQKRRTYV